ncbi:hypothetical protein ACQEVG_18200 [Streptomyces sp. CA-135486]|uniref:hypothetical protein n=1 Tax=Streptomyces sp. CA-135486 TaxID=3240049 RepID=UPI003D940BED
MNPSIKRAIASLDEAAWQHIRYPRAFVDPDTGELISDAQAEREHATPSSNKSLRTAKPPLWPTCRRGGSMPTPRG